MATTDSISLSGTANLGYIHADHVSQRSADKVSELLMRNHEQFHIFFDGHQLHNHILHHLLAIYALGATPDEIQDAYDRNARYQLFISRAQVEIEEDLYNVDVFLKYIGKPACYSSFLKFFKNEISAKGIAKTVDEYVFKGDKRANEMFIRLYDGLLHGLIHLGYGIEFQQPLIVAEALAETALTSSYLGDIIERTSQHIHFRQQRGVHIPNSSLMTICSRLRTDPLISHAVQSCDGPNKIRDGLIAHAKEKMVPYLAEFRVQPHQLKQKVAEMANTSLYVAATAQRPEKVEMFDFVLLHAVNTSPWMSVFIEQPWISDDVKCKLVQVKGWIDLILYAACKTPSLYPERVLNYHPKKPGDWNYIFDRACKYNDDGHTAKFIRAIRYVERISKDYKGNPGLPLRPDLCLNISHMVMDSVDRQNDRDYRLPKEAVFFPQADEEVKRLIFRFVRFSGLDDAWKHVPDRAAVANL